MDPVLATALTVLVWVIIVGVALVIVLHVLAWLAVIVFGALGIGQPRRLKPPVNTFTRFTK